MGWLAASILWLLLVVVRLFELLVQGVRYAWLGLMLARLFVIHVRIDAISRRGDRLLDRRFWLRQRADRLRLKIKHGRGGWL